MYETGVKLNNSGYIFTKRKKIRLKGKFYVDIIHMVNKIHIAVLYNDGTTIGGLKVLSSTFKFL